MATSDGYEDKASESAAGGVEEFGRKAAELLKQAGPKVGRFVDETRPRVEKAGREAFEYARTHEDELKAVAAKLARTRFTGPLGFVVEGLARQSVRDGGAAPVACASCGSSNPAGSRFCNQCGADVSGTESGASEAN